MELAGCTTVVTGAAGGIGSALAERFHTEGARVVLSDLPGPRLQALVDRLEAARAGSAIAVPADIGTEEGNAHLVRSAEAAFGPIDLFFANEIGRAHV